MTYQGYSSHQAWELAVAIDNDADCYKQRGEWLKNYARKMQRGKYTHALAIKGIRDNFVPQCITLLNKKGLLMYSTYPKTIKEEVAKHVVGQIEEEIKWYKKTPGQKIPW